MSSSGANKTVRVLIMDDDVDLLQLMQLKLQKQGFLVTTSHCGEQFLDQLHNDPPAIILLDIQMPGLDGASICKLLKASPGSASIPVLMFSANDDVESISNLCGADGFIRKPFLFEAFASQIMQTLEAKQMKGSAA